MRRSSPARTSERVRGSPPRTASAAHRRAPCPFGPVPAGSRRAGRPPGAAPRRHPRSAALREAGACELELDHRGLAAPVLDLDPVPDPDTADEDGDRHADAQPGEPANVAITSATIPARMSPTPRAADGADDPGSTLSASINASVRVGGETSTRPPARAMTTDCSSSRIRAFAASLACASSAAADTTVSAAVAASPARSRNWRVPVRCPLARSCASRKRRVARSARREARAARSRALRSSRVSNGRAYHSGEPSGGAGAAAPRAPGAFRPACWLAAWSRCQGAPSGPVRNHAPVRSRSPSGGARRTIAKKKGRGATPRAVLARRLPLRLDSRIVRSRLARTSAAP